MKKKKKLEIKTNAFFLVHDQPFVWCSVECRWYQIEKMTTMLEMFICSIKNQK